MREGSFSYIVLSKAEQLSNERPAKTTQCDSSMVWFKLDEMETGAEEMRRNDQLYGNASCA